MNDMRAVIIPKSDQLNADSLISGPVTITIARITIMPGEQPVSVFYDGGLPWKPCKSMARVLVHCWGPDANNYIGKSLTLYRDEKVKWGGMAVGGIRVSHMSDIKAPVTLALTETKGSKKLFTVMPLVIAAPAPTRQPTPAPDTADDRYPSLITTTDPKAWLVELRNVLAVLATEDEIHEIASMGEVNSALTKAPTAYREEIGNMLAEALARVMADDGSAAHEPEG